MFRHNDAPHLEAMLRESIAEGQPRTHRPWKKVLVIVEGIYSMEGEACCLKEIVQVCVRGRARGLAARLGGWPGHGSGGHVGAL